MNASKTFPFGRQPQTWRSRSLLGRPTSGFEAKVIFANQIQRAALSVSNNIAEGFERGSTNELLQFLYIARGSAGEVRSMLCIVELMDPPADLKSQMSDLKSLSETTSRQLRGWADSLENSDIKGQRHLDERTRHEYDQQKRTTAFHDQIRTMAEQPHLAREEQRRHSVIPRPPECRPE